MSYPEVSADNLSELNAFINIGAWLEKQGIKAPALYSLHKDKCLAVFEDLGNISFGSSLKQGGNQENLYQLATNVLCILRDAECSDLPDYYDGKVHANRRQLIDYYVGYIKKEGQHEGVVDEYNAVWQEIERSLPPCPKGFVHGDFHLENLIYKEGEEGIKQCALIDYQDAMHGPLPYDLLNLLENARATVPEKIKKEMIGLYCRGMSEQDKKAFTDWYGVLSAQFHGRVLGLFIKLAAEQGRDSYLCHIPRLQNYMIESLKNPLLKPLKQWFEKEGVDFAPIKDLDGDRIRSVFQNISF